MTRIEESKETLGLPGKRGDKVICHYKGRNIPGVIVADDVMDRSIKGILLEEQVGSDDSYMCGYGVTIGPDAMRDPSKIEKTGVCTDEELLVVDTREKVLLKRATR